jgi:hypothetical protein
MYQFESFTKIYANFVCKTLLLIHLSINIGHLEQDVKHHRFENGGTVTIALSFSKKKIDI